jgi:hypothetical protein
LNSPSFTDLRTTGNVTIATPASGVALTVNGQAGAQVVSIQSAATSDAAILFGITSSQQWNLRTTFSDGSFRLYDQTRAAYPLIVSTSGNVTIAAPVSGTTLTTTGTAAGTAAIRLDTTATIGAQTATWTAPTNKPGAAAGVVTRWIPINLDGTTYYIPAWT